MVNHRIDKAISLVESHQDYINIYEDMLDFYAEVNMQYSEDGSEYKQDITKQERKDDDSLSNCLEELKYHKHELERAKVRLRICILTFNKGWTF